MRQTRRSSYQAGKKTRHYKKPKKSAQKTFRHRKGSKFSGGNLNIPNSLPLSGGKKTRYHKK